MEIGVECEPGLRVIGVGLGLKFGVESVLRFEVE
jgi:hypothetical protein